jgi:hypothetical protein
MSNISQELWDAGVQAAMQRDADSDAAVAFRESLVPRADGHAHGVYPLWHGWALVEAFQAGAAHARALQKSEPSR